MISRAFFVLFALWSGTEVSLTKSMSSKNDERRVSVPGSRPIPLPNIRSAAYFAEDGECQRIDIDLCKNIGYNMTRMPNRFGHERQMDAEMQLKTFGPLMQFGCHDNLTFFLCSIHVPMCDSSINYAIGESIVNDKLRSVQHIWDGREIWCYCCQVWKGINAWIS